MRRLFNFGWIIIGILVFTGCVDGDRKSYKNNKGQQVEELYYRSGGLKSRTIYLHENTEYIYIEYYDDQVLKDSLHVKDGKTEGERIFFDQSGDLKHTEHYLNGLLDGTHMAEYSNGIRSFEGFRKNGLMVGEWIFHYPDGRPITYEFYDSTGHVKYLEKFGITGEMRSIEGNGLIDSKLNLLEAASGDTLFGEALTILPPASTVTLDVFAYKEADRKIELYSNKTNHLLSRFPVIINEAGIYTVDFNLTIIENNSGKSQTYLQSYTLNLK